MRVRQAFGLLGLLFLMVVTGCASSNSSSTSTSPPTTSVPATTAPASTPSVGSSAQQVTVTPSSGLTSPATVQVAASGFSPHESLIVIECANKGNATGEGDCNLAASESVTSDATGHVATKFAVVKGPFGANKIVCATAQACIVSVSQAALTPTQQGDEPISFS